MKGKPPTVRTIFVMQLLIAANALAGWLWWLFSKGNSGLHPWFVVNAAGACGTVACAFSLRTGRRAAWWASLLINIPLLNLNGLNIILQILVIFALFTREVRYFFGLTEVSATSSGRSAVRGQTSREKVVRGVVTVAIAAMIFGGFPQLVMFLLRFPYRDIPESYELDSKINDYFEKHGRVPDGADLEKLTQDIPVKTNILQAYRPLSTNVYAFVYPHRFVTVTLLNRGRVNYGERRLLSDSGSNAVMQICRKLQASDKRRTARSANQ